MPGRGSLALQGARIWLPAAIALAGIALIVAGGDSAVGAGIVLVGVALLVAFLNLLVRAGIASQRDREREEEARTYFDRHGRWPRGR
jgi:drug/metabolite transporter (DMT)-like permease